MKLPNGITEDQFVKTANIVASRLAKRFRFGYHDKDDMKQQAIIFAIEGVEKYDGIRPLENFLWTHVKNRLCNFKRDKYERTEKPCAKCPCSEINDIDEDGCSQYIDREECYNYKLWLTRNSNKKNLMNTINIYRIDNTNEKNMEINATDNSIYNEMIEIIEKNLPANLRSSYIKLKFYNKLNINKRLEIQAAIQKILEENGYGNS